MTYRNVVREGRPNHRHNEHAQKFSEVRPCSFRGIPADRHTETLTTVLRTRLGGGERGQSKHFSQPAPHYGGKISSNLA